MKIWGVLVTLISIPAFSKTQIISCPGAARWQIKCGEPTNCFVSLVWQCRNGSINMIRDQVQVSISRAEAESFTTDNSNRVVSSDRFPEIKTWLNKVSVTTVAPALYESSLSSAASPTRRANPKAAPAKNWDAEIKPATR